VKERVWENTAYIALRYSMMDRRKGVQEKKRGCEVEWMVTVDCTKSEWM
jgi:hypothetical protein